jgi:Cu2+-exporting ATPase
MKSCQNPQFLCSASLIHHTLSFLNFKVEDAQGNAAPVQRLADAIAGPFVYTIMSLSAMTFAFWYGPLFIFLTEIT